MKFTLQMGPVMQRQAMRWAAAIRTRARWSEDDESRRSHGKACRDVLEGLGLPAGALDRIADQSLVQVTVPFSAEDERWEARIFPWEYVLSTATADARGHRPLAIVRHLACAESEAPTHRPEKLRLLVQECAPPGPSETAHERLEDAVVRGILNSFGPSQTWSTADPDLAAVRRAIEDFKPDMVHIASNAVRVRPAGSEQRRFADLLSSTLPGDAEAVATAVTAASTKPLLVAYNSPHSAGRVAALTVANGATYAIGLQDEIDPVTRRTFFAALYTAWNFRRGLAPFLWAWQEVRRCCRNLRGTGIVLWSRNSLLGDPVKGWTPERVIDDLTLNMRPSHSPRREPGENILHVEIEPYSELNYAMLHNDRPPLRAFRITQLAPATVENVQVRVDLDVGTRTFSYRRKINLDGVVTDLAEKVRLPLIWTTAPIMHESIRSTMTVEVIWHTLSVHCDTYPVVLLPTSEWRDTESDRIWLPSFVLPRDPAVPKIVAAAQRYLLALADDLTAGFDGYQSENAPGNQGIDPVEAQVRALWLALVLEQDLGYINPPPTYTDKSQRIRTPSDVIRGGRGTCLDLALLFASCLEYIEIHPVIVLLAGHAFVGYWGNSTAYEEFSMESVPATNSDVPVWDADRGGDIPVYQQYAWSLGRDRYAEVRSYVDSGKLVPIEATALTRRKSFIEALELGAENLRSAADFDTLLDVRMARAHHVTPLPLQETAP